MKRLIKLLTISAFILLIFHSASAQSLIVVGTVTISNDTTFSSVTVTSTGILIADGEITVTGDMVVESGGVVTHSLRQLQGLRLNVLDTLDIQSGGLIDLNAKGLRGGNNGSIFSAIGEAFDDSSQIIMGANGGGGNFSTAAGASYGGLGADGSDGVTNAPYGILEDPMHLGSGGGGTTFGNRAAAGHGGGLARITAQTCIINGTVRVNGGSGSFPFNTRPSGGGSGGGIRLDVSTLSGSGIIEARGGNGATGGGGLTSGRGGGGRIAIYYDTFNFPEGNISASSATVGFVSSAGTIYLKDNALSTGKLIIDNDNFSSGLYTPLKTTLTMIGELTLLNGGRLNALSDDITSFTVEQPISITNSSSFLLGDGVTMTVSNSSGFDLNVESSSSLILQANSTFGANALRVNGSTFDTFIDLNFPNATDLELSGGSTLNIFDSTTFSVGVFDPTNIQTGTVNLTAGSVLEIAANTATLNSGVTLIKDGTFSVPDSIGSLTIKSGGIVTHSSRNLSGLRLNISDTLDIQFGGFIDLNIKGLRGGNNGSIFSAIGEAFDDSSQIIMGANGGGGNNSSAAGASYGGLGADGNDGVTNAPYGILEDPMHLGSGGGGTTFGNRAAAGHGGGLARITAQTCIINGTVRANGGSGTIPFNTRASGGGSGGGIRLDVGSLSGSGVVEVRGGNGVVAGFGGSISSGSGGGGRIAIYYDALSFPVGNISASGASVGLVSSAGTIYLKDNAQSTGKLIIDNDNFSSSLDTPLKTNLTTLRDLTVQNLGALSIDFEITVANDLFLSTGGRIVREQ